MIQHWVRKGRIQEIQFNPDGATHCGPCGVKTECPFAASPIKRYALITGTTRITPSCSH